MAAGWGWRTFVCCRGLGHVRVSQRVKARRTYRAAELQSRCEGDGSSEHGLERSLQVCVSKAGGEARHSSGRRVWVKIAMHSGRESADSVGGGGGVAAACGERRRA